MKEILLEILRHYVTFRYSIGVRPPYPHRDTDFVAINAVPHAEEYQYLGMGEKVTIYAPLPDPKPDGP